MSNNNDKREQLREKGQFWTPDWVAKAMISYVVQPSETILDLGVGAGAFYDALLTNYKDAKEYNYLGIDIDNILLENLNNRKISPKHVFKKRDYILENISEKFGAIISNPPYIRHHRLSKDTKDKLASISISILGKKIDGRAGIHVYFLLLALDNLKKNGKLAFIMPADTCEGIFAKDVWIYISLHYCIEAVVTFSQKATPFPNIDTNAVIFLITNKPKRQTIYKIHCHTRSENDLFDVIKNNCLESNKNVDITEVELEKALKVGLSRDTNSFKEHVYALKDFAKVMRGIATGENNFFFMDSKTKSEYHLEDKYFIKAIGRTRDIKDDLITEESLNILDKQGRPTYLLSLDGVPFKELSQSVQKYIKYGENKGINKKALISTRNPWYKMEVRKLPPFLFAYLGRSNVRFIRNNSSAVPLTSFLCVYPSKSDKKYIEKLWKVLNHPDTLANLKFAGKSYGSGAIKVEPRSLERLAIPDNVLRKFDLQPEKQMLLNF